MQTCKKTPRKAGDYMNTIIIIIIIIRWWWWWWWLLRQFLGSQTAPLGAHKHVADKSQRLLVHLDRYLALSCAQIVRDPSSDLSANDAKQSFHKLCSVHQIIPPYLGTGKSFDNFDMFWNVLMFWDVLRCFEMLWDVLSQCHLLLSVSCHLFHDHWLNRHYIYIYIPSGKLT